MKEDTQLAIEDPVPLVVNIVVSGYMAYATGQLFKISAWHLLAILHQLCILVLFLFLALK